MLSCFLKTGWSSISLCLLLLLLFLYSHFNHPAINVSFILFVRKLAKQQLALCVVSQQRFLSLFDPYNNLVRPAGLLLYECFQMTFREVNNLVQVTQRGRGSLCRVNS